ncbi:MAG: siderophore-interacting protein, partial [Propionibacteriaceae bacterium]
QLVGRERISPTFLRITLAGDDLATVSDVVSDQRVKLILGTDDELTTLAQAKDWYETWLELGDTRPAIRTYTLIAVSEGDNGAGTATIDVCDHPGKASDFARSAPLGSTLGLFAPDRRVDGYREIGIGWHPQGAHTVFLLADQTALPAAMNILAGLAAEVKGEAHLEVPFAADIRELAAPCGVSVVWHVKESGECALTGLAARSCQVPDDLDDELLWDEGSGESWYGWIAGETGWVRQARTLAKEAGYPLKNMSIMGYWKRGVTF